VGLNDLAVWRSEAFLRGWGREGRVREFWWGWVGGA